MSPVVVALLVDASAFAAGAGRSLTDSLLVLGRAETGLVPCDANLAVFSLMDAESTVF